MNPADDLDLARLLDLAVQAARSPSGQILRHFNASELSIDNKSDGSPVTFADREAESLIRQALKSDHHFGSFDILGEEHGLEGTGTRFRWLVDPIDGTRSFINKIPLFGTIVALEDHVEKRPLAGVIHLPVLNLTYAGARGFGTTCNGRPVKVSSDTQLEDSIISIGDFAQFISAKRKSAYRQLGELCPYLRAYTDCFGHALVVTGSVGAMLDPVLNPWDVLATQVLVEEAGGKMVVRPSVVSGKVDVLFGTPTIVNLLCDRLQF